MTARIAKGGATTRRAPARGGSGSSYKRKKAAAPPPGLLDSLPVSPETARKIARWGGLLFVLIFALAFAFALRLPQKIGDVAGRAIGDAGFAVSRVEVRGLSRMDRRTVYQTVLGQPSLAMPLIDLDVIRDQLMQQRWIREARVSRRLPDTLVVEIEERVPAAVWQLRGRLTLVDADGFEIEPVSIDNVPNLPRVIGPGAQRQLASLNALLAAAPRLRPLITGAEWVGDRRWDIYFQTREVLSLPDNDQQAQAALRHFAEADERNRYLGGNFARFDMRIEGQMIVRLRSASDQDGPAGPGGVPAASSGPAAPAAPRAQPQPARPARPAETANPRTPQDFARTT